MAAAIGCVGTERRGGGTDGPPGGTIGDAAPSSHDAVAEISETDADGQPAPGPDGANESAPSTGIFDAGAAEASMDGGGGDADTQPINVLLYNASTGYGHQSRETAIPILQAAAAENGIKLDLTYALTAVEPEGPGDDSNYNNHLPGAKPIDNSAFVPGGLDKYDVVFFLNTGGMPLSADGFDQAQIHQQALQNFLEQMHRGFVGTHSTSDTYQNNSWPWYVDMLGANFLTHSGPGTQGTARWNPGVSHPILTASTAPNPWHRQEEWYTFTRDVTTLPGFTVLLLGDEDDHQFPERPSAWVHDLSGGGRVFYTAFGHAVSAFEEPKVMQLIITGIKWAAHRL